MNDFALLPPEGEPSADEASELGERLARLRGVQAPPTLLPAVLGRLGLDDAYALAETPIGPVFVAWGPAGIAAVMPADVAGDAADFERRLAARFGRRPRRADRPPAEVARALAAFVRGLSDAKRLRFDLHGLSEFERAVLRKTLEIPRGEVRPYAWVAREIGRPGAVRAVGSALGRNPIPLLIPCHRVIRSDGRIGDYALGGERKRALLTLEGIDTAALEAQAAAGTRYLGSDTTRIFCLPTCRNARRIAEPHRVAFASAQAAATAGYRPCKVCRPA